jgi:hypothetical protein
VTDEAGIGAIITVRWEDEQVADYCFCDISVGQTPHYVTVGAELLTALRGRVPDALVREEYGKGSYPLGGVYVDVPAHALWVRECGTLNPAYLERVREAWPGWRVEENVDGLAEQVRLSGRDPALVAAPLDQMIADLLLETRHTP